MAFDYDPSDVASVVDLDAQFITQMHGSVSGPVYQTHTMLVDSKRLKPFYFTGTPVLGSSINDYMAGTFYILATSPNNIIG